MSPFSIMDKDELLKRVKDKKYISGIYNYCDRWCERCQFTSRCLNCTLAEEQFGDLQKKDELNEVFWQRFSEMLHDTLTLVKEIAKEKGLDIDSIDLEKDYGNEDTTKENPLMDLISHTSENYSKKVNDWFNSNEQILLEKEYEINQIRLIGSQNDPVKESADINDAIEIIRWYQYQIHIKLKRACESASENESMDCREIPKDSDGSAKVALIGIDRSISAWNILLPYFSDQKGQIIDLIVLLENIRNRVEIRFPDARNFIRPGFDEIELT